MRDDEVFSVRGLGRGWRAAVALALGLCLGAPAALAQETASGKAGAQQADSSGADEAAEDGAAGEMAEAPPLTVAVLARSRANACYDNGAESAIRTLTQLEADRINASGLLGARRLEVSVLDGPVRGDDAVEDLRGALDDPTLLGLVGLRRNRSAEGVFEALGPDIKASGVPFITNLSLQSLIQPYPNVFSLRVSQEEEQIPAIRSFLRDSGFTRPAFIGRKGSSRSQSLGDGLAKRSLRTLGPPLAVDLRLDLPRREAPDPAVIEDAVAALKAANADVVFLAVGSRHSTALMRAMIRSSYTPPVFVSGWIERLFGPRRLSRYPTPVYALAWNTLPNIQSERLRRLVDRMSDQGVVFGGVKNETAEGWTNDRCRENPNRIWSTAYTRGNLRAATRGAEYADMVGLIAEAAATAPRDATIEELRAHVVEAIRTRYAAGRGAYEGLLANWSFRPGTRTATRTPAILERPVGAEADRLAAIQYVRLRGETLKRVQTYYMDIDLVRLFRVDDSAGTFFAEMYLSLYDQEGASIDKIDFANAFIDPDTNRRTIEIVELHDGGPSDAYPEGMKLYKITGRFMFRPDFETYPFDTQRFSVDIKPKKSDEAMILQPPAAELRDRVYETEGWSVRDQYVSYDEDFTPLVNAHSGERRIAPYYKASFVWIMERQATDYYLRVAIPLLVILAVAYLSVFIARDHFEAIVTIQVTALLSAVALYLAVPKVDSETATLSDKIFLADYIAVFLMISTSILRANWLVRKIPLLPAFFSLIHMLAAPVIVALMGLYIYELSHPGVINRAGFEEIAEETPTDTEASTAAR